MTFTSVAGGRTRKNGKTNQTYVVREKDIDVLFKNY